MTHILFQFISVLKMLIEHVQLSEDVLTVNLTSTLYALAGFITRFHEPASHRVRLKFCGLCDAIFSRKDIVGKLKEGPVRQHVLDIVLEWIQDPAQVCLKLPSSFLVS